MAIMFIGIALAGYEYYEFRSDEVTEMDTQRQALEGQISERQQELRRLEDFARNIEQIKLELRELNLQLESALEYMPRQFNLSGLLRKLTMLAQNSGLDLYSFRPSGKEERADGVFYSTLLIDFDIKGSFTQIVVFFDQISRLKRIINAEELKLQVDNQANQVAGRTGPTNLSVVARVKTYRFSE